MEVLHNGFTLSICDSGFPLSTDSVALSGFVKLPKQAKVLDLGAGCGTLGLLLCANNDDCQVTGIELDEAAHNCALENSRANGITSRLTSICADLRQVSEYIPAGSFHCCVSNPPYFSAGPKSLQTPSARRSDLCSTEDLFRSAAWALRYGGDFFLVHRPETLGQLCYWGTKYQLEPKKLCLLRHRPDGPVTLVLLHCRKGGKPGLVWQEECLQDADGQPSQYYKTLYHL